MVNVIVKDCLKQLPGLVFITCVVLCLSEPANAQVFNVNGDNNNCSGANNPPVCSFEVGAGTSIGSPGSNSSGSYTATLTVFNLTNTSIHLSVQVSTSKGGNWLSAGLSPNPIPGNGSGVVSIVVNAQNLPPNIYSGSITISGGGESETIQVTLQTDGISLALSPNSVAVTLAPNGTTTKNINYVPAGGVSATVTSNQSFVTISSSGGNGFSITINAPQSSATAIVTVQFQGGGSPFVAVALPVSVTVMSPSNPVASPGSLSFSAFQGRANPPAQAFSVTTSDGSSQTVSVTGMPSFVSVSPGSGTASSSPARFTVNASTSAMKLGSNTGAINLALATGGTTSVSVNATLSPFSIGVSPTSVPSVILPQGKSQVIAFQVVTVDGAQAPVSVTTQTNTGGGWLNVNSSAITAPTSAVRACPAGWSTWPTR